MRTIVIGAGPAGCITAVALANAGADVTLIDEQATIGGHLRYDAGYDPPGWLDELAAALSTTGARIRLSSVAWATFRVVDGIEVMVTGPAGPESLTCDRLVLAPGTTDRELIVDGATLPGVMTERALRILFEIHGVIPGDRFAVIADRADRVERLVRDLQTAGATSRILDPGSVSRIDGMDRVQAISINDGESLPVDVVVLALGERPDTQLAGMLEVPRSFSSEQDAWFVPGPDCGNGIFCIGGALRGPATARDLVSDGLACAGSILVSNAGLPDSMPISAGLLGERTIR